MRKLILLYITLNTCYLSRIGLSERILTGYKYKAGLFANKFIIIRDRKLT